MKDIKDNEHLVGVDDWDFIFDWVQEQRPATVARLIRQIEYENTIIKGGGRESWRESRLKSGTGEPMSRDSPEVSRTLDSGPVNPVALDQLLAASCCLHGHGHSASLCGACGQDGCAPEARAEAAEKERDALAQAHGLLNEQGSDQWHELQDLKAKLAETIERKDDVIRARNKLLEGVQKEFTVELFEDANQWGYGKELAIYVSNDLVGSFFAEHNGVRAIILWLQEQEASCSKEAK